MAVLDEKNYHDEQNNLNTLRMREVESTLPSFCKQFFRGVREYTSSRTRLAYAYDLRVFFEFLHSQSFLVVLKYQILNQNAATTTERIAIVSAI